MSEIRKGKLDVLIFVAENRGFTATALARNRSISSVTGASSFSGLCCQHRHTQAHLQVWNFT